MSESIACEIARDIVDGKMTLGTVVSLFGYSIAEQVYKFTVTRPFQPVKWIRHIR